MTDHNDLVNHPSHYKKFNFEAIDVIDEVAPAFEPKLSFSIGNALKYILRAPFKGTTSQDLEKAVWYLEHAIKLLDVK
ncbi:phage-related protein [Weissella oryzae SG25]|uniref:Phage-related protein n=1 Tax=Weissella oryzae (strain DSM 25784 / JCM 18191 / LMG 30913 / SG25) TaxID=1329250 RepID=A0A069CWQ1_WEIOS|nr:DUF3310 domain-containing protein [Weissella oryzae]GAK31889.1 phage-related protein [Weissella oryzae SG25]